MTGYLYRTSSGALVLDKCSDDATHAAAPPEPYDPDKVGDWRRRCRVHLDDLLDGLLGKRVKIDGLLKRRLIITLLEDEP